jgi:hypothetical protein
MFLVFSLVLVLDERMGMAYQCGHFGKCNAHLLSFFPMVPDKKKKRASCYTYLTYLTKMNQHLLNTLPWMVLGQN